MPSPDVSAAERLTTMCSLAVRLWIGKTRALAGYTALSPCSMWSATAAVSPRPLRMCEFASLARLPTNSARWDESRYNTTARSSRSINQGSQCYGTSVFPPRRAMWATMVRRPVGDDRCRKEKYGSLRVL